MAEFLDTTGVSYRLKQLINNAKRQLVLISPYLKINRNIKDALEDKDRMKMDIRLIYGKSELMPEEINWLKSQKSIRTSFSQNLHSKCYLNENEAIVTSMNLYEYSQVNNHEMGIYVTRESDSALYAAIDEEVQRLIRGAEEVSISVEKVVVKSAERETKVPPATTGIKAAAATHRPSAVAPAAKATGFCIRCGQPKTYNPKYPLCDNCYEIWAKYKNKDYEESNCHRCGKSSDTSVGSPLCKPCWTEENRR